jgi:transposase
VTEKRTHDYRRHGTTNLFAALDTTTGQVIGGCYPRRTGADFLAFCKKAVKPHAGKDIHIIRQLVHTRHSEVRAWLAANPHVTFHFTPIGSSWLNQIETWFGIITRQAIRRGTFSSVNALVFTIRDYIAAWNADATPFVWTDRRRDPGQGRLGSGQHQETRRQQCEVTPPGSRDTSRPGWHRTPAL